MVAHAVNHCTQETEAEGLQVQGQPELCSKTLMKKRKGRGWACS